jgi:hypothetical protein
MGLGWTKSAHCDKAEDPMIDLFFQMIPGWIVESRSPMNEGGHRAWQKTRTRGLLPYLLLWAVGMGGFLFAFELGWNRFVEHTQIDPLFAQLYAAGCVLVSLIVGAVDWNGNESRSRKADKSASAASAHSR